MMAAVERSQFASLSADQSAAVLAAKLRAHQPFSFLRYGDGALECMTGRSGWTRDFEQYSSQLGEGLREAWHAVIESPSAFIGDWLSASFDVGSEYSRYEQQYRALVGVAQPKWLHFETLLLMRESRQILDFYLAVKEDSRRKLFMGPAVNRGAAEMLGADFLEVPMSNLLNYVPAITADLVARKFDVLLYGAGMAGTIPVVNCWKKFPLRTYVNVGSGLDPLFRGRTRHQQLHVGRARQMFSELLA